MRRLPSNGTTAVADPAPPGKVTAPVAKFAAPPAPYEDAVRNVLSRPETAHVLHSVWSGDPAVIVPSPPGSGKTQLVALLAVALAHRAGMRVGIAAQTRDQAAELARRIAPLSDRVKIVWPKGRPKPDLNGCPVGSGGYPANGGGIVIATTARWTFSQPHTDAGDVMLVDEGWQCTHADLGALGAFCSQIVCVGDPGQIAPVVTGRTTRWRNLPTGPQVPGPDALSAAHGDALEVVALRHTWRLGPETTALIQPTFYPSLPFTSRRPPEHLAASDGTVMPEVVAVTATASTSPAALIDACTDRVRDLLTTNLHEGSGVRPVTAADIAVVCPHVAEAAALRAALSDEPGLLIGTANQLQGLERRAVVALHPLAGQCEASPFALDLGRMCVLLTRHRAHLSLILDGHETDLLAATDPETPGADTHSALLNQLGDAP